jgi:hypothetical protein
LIKIDLIDGPSPDRLSQPEIGYTLKMFSFENEVLYSFKFSINPEKLYAPPKEWFDEEGNQIYIPNETISVENETNIVLVFPYFKNAEKVNIYDSDDSLILSVDVSKYATCNMNNICNSNENYYTCPEDCKSQLNFTAIITIIGGIIVVVLIIIYIILKKRQKPARKR